MDVGRLWCGDRAELVADDMAILHLQIVMLAKLRRGEGFLLTWQGADEAGAPRSVWVHPAADVYFEFDAPPQDPVDSHLLQRLMVEANGSRGIRLDRHGHLAALGVPGESAEI